MFYVFCFLFGIAAISEASKALSGNVKFKTFPAKSSNDKVASEIIFKDRRFVASKSQQMCNRYVLQACNGTLRRSGATTITTTTTTTSTTTTTPDPNEVHILVVGGRNSAAREYPHMTLIGYGEYETVQWLCGGSLISEQFVLSAAHCSSTKSGLAAWIRLGELNLETETDDARTMDLQITERFVHPGYNPPILYHDIALFKFKTISSFSAYVRPICLNMLQNFNVNKLTAVGWGATGYGEQESPQLLSVELDIQPDDRCDQIYRGERLPDGYNASTMICAGYAPGGRDTCQGDSGGPLQFLNNNAGCSQIYTQVGIVSFGEGCAFPDTPAIYTRVSHYIPWIENIVWK